MPTSDVFFLLMLLFAASTAICFRFDVAKVRQTDLEAIRIYYFEGNQYWWRLTCGSAVAAVACLIASLATI